ncbi:MAG: hypothetical protein IJF46_04720 [Bacteroidaceae bacterium]|nr:hypothetical protein [Bacteroidaceae bacterium]
MESRLLVILLLFVLTLLPERLCAQFYGRPDTVARIIKSGVPIVRQTRTEDKAVGAKKKSPTRKKKKSAAKSKPQKAEAKRRDEIMYEPKSYRLGERVIMRGDSGADVRLLANMLVDKLFLDEKDIIYTKNGVLYEGEIIRAVRSFQKISGLYEDGMVGTPTLKALRKYR